MVLCCASIGLLNSGAVASASDAPRTLRVMIFNVWYGGDQIAFGQVAEAIKAHRAIDREAAAVLPLRHRLRVIAR